MQISIDSLFNTDGTPITTTTQTADSSDGSTLSKTDFFELLCTQLKYQDPLNPSTDTDMAAQLAQFSSLETMQNVESAINNQTEVFSEAVSALQYGALSTTNSSSISLMGKTVRLQEKSVDFDGTTAVELRVHLGNNDSAVVTLANEDGETVRTFEASDKDEQDSVLLTWDGLDDQGTICDSGTYTISIEGQDSDSELYCFNEGVVSGVRFTDNGPKVKINGKELSVSNIMEVTPES
ncbi:MAG TPA: flagellar hook capping FlgD N-terminal domain-containing protein [Chitinispirillaceae bacterium]|nr:flagellar hook capping FlgD N-terminal domain-containing protein [Chitinispirillaceae bacterium]